MVPQSQIIPSDTSNIEPDTRTKGGTSEFLGKGVVLRQHTSECCRCCCCQPNIHWDIHEWTSEISTIGHDRTGPGVYQQIEEGKQLAFVEEDADWLGRTCSWCAPGSRPTKYTYFKVVGGDKTAEILMTHSKGCTNGQNQVVAITDQGVIRCPCCCFLPYLETKDANGERMGVSRYICDMCLFVPKFTVEDNSGNIMYSVRPDTCVGGLCVMCRCCDGQKKAKCCRVPFYIRDPNTKMKIDAAGGGNAAFVDLWAGWKAECCTRRDLYELKFPAEATPEQKMTLLGLSHLIDITIFEQDE